jgi:hypothetical protein
MEISTKPEVLSPRMQRGKHLFDDENIDLLSHVLDDCFRIPGTSFRFGIYGIVGLIPGIGDILGGIASCLIVLAAWFRGVPYVTLARMVVNVALEIVIGGIPLVGDIFDIAWKANRRNYALLNRSLAEPRRHTWKDWLFLAGLTTVLLGLMAAPLLLLAWAFHALWSTNFRGHL